ncbi:DUF4129 domain-containing protein, partial [Paenibacillus phytohabitans]|uniref:DUF4129 domain-containing protein n=1 Tax=Paenibacillus phytohabitans TaxID=2654978 RepID=UPI00300A9F4C
LPAVRRAGRLSRERQLRAAALAWHGLAARYGPPLPGVTAREYADSLAIEDGRLRAAVRDFVRQWETLAYSGCAGGLAARAQPSHRGAAGADLQSPCPGASGADPQPLRSSAAVPLPQPLRSSAAVPVPPLRSDASAKDAEANDAAAFIARCLTITFRLTR